MTEPSIRFVLGLGLTAPCKDSPVLWHFRLSSHRPLPPAPRLLYIFEYQYVLIRYSILGANMLLQYVRDVQ